MSDLKLGLLVAPLGAAGKGVNHAFRAVVKTQGGEITAFVKTLPSERQLIVESTCSILGRMLSLPIPEPLLVAIPEVFGGPALAFGSASVSHPDLTAVLTSAAAPLVMEKLRRWKSLVPAACFDEWIANCDRHPGNLLFDGESLFWMIDHSLAVHDHLPIGELSPKNHLFNVATSGQPESELQAMRSRTSTVMQFYADFGASALLDALPGSVWPREVCQSVVSWLQARQNHLLRLGSSRIPAAQGDLLK